MPLRIVRNDITKMEVDAIVNPTNKNLKKGGGTSGAIFEAAGPDRLQKECDEIGGCEVGQAVITSGCDLPARYIIHTVGPIWRGGESSEARQLASCYTSSLLLAQKHDCRSLAFPLISSGTYGYPKASALQVAMAAIGDFLLEHDDQDVFDVFLVAYDQETTKLTGKLFALIEQYIDNNYVDARYQRFRRHPRQLEPDERKLLERARADRTSSKSEPRKLQDLVNQLGESFSESLLRLIAEKGKKEAETYQRANIDRRLFSKIRSGRDYQPKKTTAIAFAIALELNLDETSDLLAKAGYTLSSSHKFDLIIRYFIERRGYDIFAINEALSEFEEPLLL
ncbi:MAG: macro domain-containing protein [Candidatus Adiutrix sp.]|nr:macro domain-containing protein [Candidatus Adiutrix sp.]